MINFTISPRYKDIIYSIEKEYGEIGDFIVEDGIIGFSVYREYFEHPLETIQVKKRIIAVSLLNILNMN
jgi:hypothetical protein